VVRISSALAIGTAIGIVLPLTAYSLKVFEVPRHHEGIAGVALILAYLLLLSPLLDLLSR
jgi:multidrug transporter EmrE-like cation transporter